MISLLFPFFFSLVFLAYCQAKGQHRHSEERVRCGVGRGEAGHRVGKQNTTTARTTGSGLLGYGLGWDG